MQRPSTFPRVSRRRLHAVGVPALFLTLALLHAPASASPIVSAPISATAAAALPASSSTLTLAAADDLKKAAGEHVKGEILPKPSQGLPALIAAFLVFGITLAILTLKAWPVMLKGLQARADKIRSEIEAAEMAQEQAKAALSQYERNLADARAEAQRMLDAAKAQQQALSAELKARADAELTQMRERARRDIDAARRAALSEIYAEASQLSTLMASKILKREINVNDQQRLVEESLGEMSQAARN